jgi:hypothetical protein
LHQVVVEPTVVGHAGHEVHQAVLDVPVRRDPETLVVPAMVFGKRGHVKRPLGQSGKHRPIALRIGHEERSASATIDQVVIPAALHERVVVGFQGEQHPQPSLRVGVDDE